MHHPREFLAALLTFESGDTDKVVQYMAEADRMGIRIAPPDINRCDRDFTVDAEQVRFGLAAVKGVGAKAVDAIMEARQEGGPFTDLYHFCRLIDPRAANRATIEALIKCGAFDSLGASRAAMIAVLDRAIEIGQSAAADRKMGQLNFFDAFNGDDEDEPAPRFPDVPPWTEAQLLAAEKETLGFYVTSHPLMRHGRELANLSFPPGLTLASLEDFAGRQITVGCMVAAVRPTVTRTGRSAGKKMAMLTIEDLTGKCDAVVFSEAYEQFAELLGPESMIFLRGTVDRRRERLNIIVDDVVPIDSALEVLTGAIRLRLPPIAPAAELLRRLGELLGRHPGRCPVLLEFPATGRADVRVTVRVDERGFVKPSRELVTAAADLLGEENLLLQASPPSPNGNGRANSGFRSRRTRQASAPR